MQQVSPGDILPATFQFVRAHLKAIAIWSAVFEFAVVLLVAWFVWRFVARRLPRPSQPSEPDNRAGILARLRPRPKSGAGAVALVEPDEDSEERSFH